MRSGENRKAPGRQQGFILLAVLAALTFLALSSQGVMFVLSQQAQREREAELLRIGREFVSAIGSYYESSPGSVKTLPTALEDLIEDKRFVGTRRHLRRIYVDPMSSAASWGLVRRPDGGIEGIYSTSEHPPVRSGGADLGDIRLPPADRYADWKFVYVPATPAATR